MKKILSLSLAVLMLCASLAGCDKTPQTPAETTPTEAVTTAPVADVNYEEVYKEVLDSTYNLIATDDEKTASSGQTGILEAVARLEKEDALGVVGYTFKDLNEDGFAELIIADVAENENSWYKTSEIFAIYTIAHDMPWLIAEGFARSSYRLLEDGTLFYEGSGGAAYTIVGNFRISQGGTSLICNEYYFTSPSADDPDTLEIYTNSFGKADIDRSEKTDMTLADFENIRSDYESKAVSIDLKPFSEYK